MKKFFYVSYKQHPITTKLTFRKNPLLRGFQAYILHNSTDQAFRLPLYRPIQHKGSAARRYSYRTGPSYHRCLGKATLTRDRMNQ
jgi:hypothetical protein